jgi:glucosamine-6-phosphate deaminase
MITAFPSQSLHILPTREELGALAGAHVTEELLRLLKTQPTVRMIFAAAPSQGEMLETLAAANGVDWARVEAFHMDEYIGLSADAPQRFGNWLRYTFFDRVPIGKLVLMEPGKDPEQDAAEYAARLAEKPVDIVCLGIGMNGHLAFNDPPAEFDDPLDTKVVELHIDSRKQQVKDGLFAKIEDVPTHAITLTIPRLLRAASLFCCVPGTLKRNAVQRAFTGDIAADSPASILRNHPSCMVYLDADSAAGLA